MSLPSLDASRRAVPRLDHLIGFALCVLYVVVLWHTADDIGLSRDEGIYVDAARSYGGWIEELVRAPSEALKQESIDRAFRFNREHPPLMKVLFALGHLAHEKYGLFPTASLSFRFAALVSAGLLVWLIHVFGTRLYGRGAGLFAAFTYALLPRPFYHAHLNAFDVPITLAVTAVTYAYYRSLTSKRWVLVTGIVYGLALLTKHNSWILPGIFGLHFAFVAVVESRARRLTQVASLSRRPDFLFGMLAIGVPLFFLLWPWLWHETLPRLRAYVAFHVHHEYYNIEYFGVNYFWPPFPIAYPWVLTLFTVPLSTLALALTGLFVQLRALARQLHALLLRRVRSEEHDPTQSTVLLFGALFAPLVLISLPSTPIFGGTKHWFPAYPFLAIFAGRAFAWLVRDVRARIPAQRAPLRGLVTLGSFALLLAPSAVETAHSHPFGLSHYTVAAGGVPGAAEHGMNRQFWGFTTRSLAPYLRAVMPDGGSVYVCDTLYTSFRMLARDGHLPDSNPRHRRHGARRLRARASRAALRRGRPSDLDDLRLGAAGLRAALRRRAHHFGLPKPALQAARARGAGRSRGCSLKVVLACARGLPDCGSCFFLATKIG